MNPEIPNLASKRVEVSTLTGSQWRHRIDYMRENRPIVSGIRDRDRTVKRGSEDRSSQAHEWRYRIHQEAHAWLPSLKAKYQRSKRI